MNGKIPEFSMPPYESESAKYIVEGESPIASIELTADGQFIVIPSNYEQPIVEVSENSLATALMGSVSQSRFIGMPVSLSRAINGIICGNFIKISDTEYILPGFGSITIEGDYQHVITIYVTTEDGETYTISTRKASEAPDSKITSAVCRTWDTPYVRMKVTINNDVILDKKTPQSDFYSVIIPQLEAGLNRWAAANKMDVEFTISDLLFDDYAYPTSLLFSRSGTYMVFYSNGAQAISTWRWTDEATGKFHFSWDYDNQDNDDTQGMAGNATITFEGETMVINSTGVGVGEGITITISRDDYCTPVKYK